jgi:hypothetical protein
MNIDFQFFGYKDASWQLSWSQVATDLDSRMILDIEFYSYKLACFGLISILKILILDTNDLGWQIMR